MKKKMWLARLVPRFLVVVSLASLLLLAVMPVLLIFPTQPVYADTTENITRQVGTSSDDTCRYLVPSFWLLTDVDLQAGAASSTSYKSGTGERFTNITIPKGATIIQSYLILKACIGDTGITYPVNTRISAENVDDAPTFADNATIFDTRWANRTTAKVDWDAIPAWTKDTVYKKRLRKPRILMLGMNQALDNDVDIW